MTHRRLISYLVFSFGITVITSSALAGSGEARRQVRQGIEHFRAGDFTASEKAFEQAETALPTDSRVKFDRACALAAAGHHDEAVELFETLAMDRDRILASESLYNLGCIATQQAKSALGPDPSAAAAEARQNSTEKISTAGAHFRRCLQVNSAHEPARHNLELLRLWSKHMQDLWKQRDRDRVRRETELLPFLEMIEQRQQVLRDSTHQQTQAADSPRRRMVIRKLSDEQRELVDELPVLIEKLSAALTSSDVNRPPAASGTSDSAAIQQALAQLARFVDAVRKSMVEAADALKGQDSSGALTKHEHVLDRLNEIYIAIAPFDHLLNKATTRQQDLVDRSRELISADSQTNSTTESEPPEFNDLASRQSRIADWMVALPIKARAMLSRLPAGTAVSDEKQSDQSQIPLIVGPENESTAESTAAPTNSVAQADSAQADSGQADSGQADTAQASQRQMLEKAVELAPDIERLTREAANDLVKQSASAAFPKQERALKLLKEIAKSMPPSQQQQNDQKPNQDQQDSPNEKSQDKQQDKQNEKRDESSKQPQDQDQQGEEQDQGSQDEQRKSNDEQRSQKQQQAGDKNQDPKHDPQKQRPDGSPQTDGQPQAAHSLDQREIESALSKVRQREREYRDAQKKLRALRFGPVRVDRDW